MFETVETHIPCVGNAHSGATFKCFLIVASFFIGNVIKDIRTKSKKAIFCTWFLIQFKKLWNENRNRIFDNTD